MAAPDYESFVAGYTEWKLALQARRDPDKAECRFQKGKKTSAAIGLSRRARESAGERNGGHDGYVHGSGERHGDKPVVLTEQHL
jgi:hypothetical protein